MPPGNHRDQSFPGSVSPLVTTSGQHPLSRVINAHATPRRMVAGPSGPRRHSTGRRVAGAHGFCGAFLKSFWYVHDLFSGIAAAVCRFWSPLPRSLSRVGDNGDRVPVNILITKQSLIFKSSGRAVTSVTARLPRRALELRGIHARGAWRAEPATVGHGPRIVAALTVAAASRWAERRQADGPC